MVWDEDKMDDDVSWFITLIRVGRQLILKQDEWRDEKPTPEISRWVQIDVERKCERDGNLLIKLDSINKTSTMIEEKFQKH